MREWGDVGAVGRLSDFHREWKWARLKAVDYAEALAIRMLVNDEPMNAMAGSLHVAKSCRADTRLRGVDRRC